MEKQVAGSLETETGVRLGAELPRTLRWGLRAGQATDTPSLVFKRRERQQRPPSTRAVCLKFGGGARVLPGKSSSSTLPPLLACTSQSPLVVSVSVSGMSPLSTVRVFDRPVHREELVLHPSNQSKHLPEPSPKSRRTGALRTTSQHNQSTGPVHTYHSAFTKMVGHKWVPFRRGSTNQDCCSRLFVAKTKICPWTCPYNLIPQGQEFCTTPLARSGGNGCLSTLQSSLV